MLKPQFLPMEEQIPNRCPRCGGNVFRAWLEKAECLQCGWFPTPKVDLSDVATDIRVEGYRQRRNRRLNGESTAN